MIQELTPDCVPYMLRLQAHCLDRGDPFMPTSTQGYLRAFAFQNFCLGVWNAPHSELLAFLTCALPTARASRNFGRGRVAEELLDGVGHMNTLLIHSDSRGKGLGKALMRAGMAQLERRGAVVFFAVVSPENLISQHMLDSLGFQRSDQITLNGWPKLLYRKDA